VVNVQGDEPLMPEALIDQVAAELAARPGADIATLAVPLQSVSVLLDPNVAKVVTDLQQRALYFSRAPIPWARDGAPAGLASQRSHVGARRHLGIYAYRVSALRRIAALPPSEHELLEQLEQLRALDAAGQQGWRRFENSLASVRTSPGVRQRKSADAGVPQSGYSRRAAAAVVACIVAGRHGNCRIYPGRASSLARMGFSAVTASNAAAKSRQMTVANTVVQLPVRSCSHAASGPPRIEPIPCAMRLYTVAMMSKVTPLLLAAIVALANTTAVHAADPAPFDLAGPVIEVTVTRDGIDVADFPGSKPCGWGSPLDQSGSATHAIGALRDGGHLSARGNQSAAGQLVFFLRRHGAANAHSRVMQVTVPQAAQQLLLFLAPETSGDYQNTDWRGSRPPRGFRTRLAGPEPGHARSLAIGRLSVGDRPYRPERSGNAQGHRSAAGAQPGDQSGRQVSRPHCRSSRLPA
jgi:hypothetical protein